MKALIWRDLCGSQGWASIETPGYGKGYVAADNWWRDVLNGLEYLRRERGMTVVLLAHSAIETINDPRATSYTSYQLRLHKRARGLVQDWCDAIGFLAPDLHVKEDDAGFGKKRARADGGSQRWLHWEGAAELRRQEPIRPAGQNAGAGRFQLRGARRVFPAAAGGSRRQPNNLTEDITNVHGTS